MKDKSKELYDSSIRFLFAERFGEDQAIRIEQAALEHENEVHFERGSDPFKWAILICIGSQCFEVDKYRKYHSITATFTDIKEWCVEVADLGSHDGSFDYLALVIGAYADYIKK